MLTDAEQEEVLGVIGWDDDPAGSWFNDNDPEEAIYWDEDSTEKPPIDSPLVRAQMTDWLLERDDIAFLGGSPGRFSVRLVDSDVHIEPTVAEALARCVLEVSRADD